MSACVLQNLKKFRVLWTDFSASCREINRFSVSKLGPEPAKLTISVALTHTCNVNDKDHVNNVFLIEMIFILKVTKSNFKGSCDQLYLILVVISYEIYDTQHRLVS